MIINIPYCHIVTSTQADIDAYWQAASFKIDDITAKFDSIAGVELKQTSEDQPIIFACIKACTQPTPNDVYWMVLYQTKLYKIHHNPIIQSAAKATLIKTDSHQQTSIPLAQLPINQALFIEANFKQLCKISSHLYQLEQQPISALLSKEEIETRLIRQADSSKIIRSDEAIEPTEQAQNFAKKLLEKYLIKTRQSLLMLVENNSSSSLQLKLALIGFLNKHWQQIKTNNLAYTALNQHPITLLCVDIAKRLAALSHKPALSYLMPGILLESFAENFEDLNNIPLLYLLGSHVLDESQQYLLPIQTLLHDTEVDMELSILKSPHGDLYNPYYDHQTIGNPVISINMLEKLYGHSSLTQQLQHDYQQLIHITNDQSTMLGQLNSLIQKLYANDAYNGIGQHTSAGAGAIPAILSFFEYYHHLNQIGFYHTSSEPSIELVPDHIKLAYLHVRGVLNSEKLYFVNKFNNSVYLIANTSQPLKYDINLLQLDALSEFEEIKSQISNTCPILIKIPEQNTQFIVTSSNGQFNFASIRILDELNKYFPNNKKHLITYALNNVAPSFYDLIAETDTYVETKTLKDLIAQSFQNDVDVCNHQQIHQIAIHTNHDYLLEKTQIPESLQKLIHELWQYIQNSVVNFSVTASTQTCISRIANSFDIEKNLHAKTLSEIYLKENNIVSLFQERKSQLEKTQCELKHQLMTHQYYGVDKLPLTIEVLSLLDVNLEINHAADLKWLLQLPERFIEAVLNDPFNKKPAQIFNQQTATVADIIELIQSAPDNKINFILVKIKIKFESLFQQQYNSDIADNLKIIANIINIMPLSKLEALCRHLIPPKNLIPRIYHYFGYLDAPHQRQFKNLFFEEVCQYLFEQLSNVASHSNADVLENLFNLLDCYRLFFNDQFPQTIKNLFNHLNINRETLYNYLSFFHSTWPHELKDTQLFFDIFSDTLNNLFNNTSWVLLLKSAFLKAKPDVNRIIDVSNLTKDDFIFISKHSEFLQHIPLHIQNDENLIINLMQHYTYCDVLASEKFKLNHLFYSRVFLEICKEDKMIFLNFMISRNSLEKSRLEILSNNIDVFCNQLPKLTPEYINAFFECLCSTRFFTCIFNKVENLSNLMGSLSQDNKTLLSAKILININAYDNNISNEIWLAFLLTDATFFKNQNLVIKVISMLNAADAKQLIPLLTVIDESCRNALINLKVFANANLTEIAQNWPSLNESPCFMQKAALQNNSNTFTSCATAPPYINQVCKNSKAKNHARRLRSHANIGLLFNSHKKRKPNHDNEQELPNLPNPASFEPR